MATIKVIATKIPAGNQVNGESEDGFLTVLVGREVATVTTKINGVPVMACACCILDDNRRMLRKESKVRSAPSQEEESGDGCSCQNE